MPERALRFQSFHEPIAFENGSITLITLPMKNSKLVDFILKLSVRLYGFFKTLAVIWKKISGQFTAVKIFCLNQEWLWFTVLAFRPELQGGGY